jgi:hypothetical protein
MTSTRLRAANIVAADEPALEEPSWSWRKSWYSGSDSIYAVFAKFASLNRIKPRDLCELFVEPNDEGLRVRLVGKPYYPKVDLRYSNHVRYGRLANILQLDAEQLRQGFVSEQFPNAVSLASPNLVWCPQCAESGYHAAAFQLNFYRRCPLHRRELRRSCIRCERPLPYWLYPPSSAPFFVCPHCGHDHARRLRETRINLALEDEAANMFADHIELVRFLVSLPTLVNAQKVAMGAPHLPIMISKADAFRRRAAFHQFVTDMLASVAARRGLPQGQLESQQPSAIYSERYMALPEITKNSRIKRDPDEALQGGALIYRTMRRWLRRRVVRQHRACLAAAQNHLWWDLDGESTAALCPVAMAYVRWRMQWEGCRIPRGLGQQKIARIPLGLLGWVSSDAPMPSPMWTKGLTLWVTNHLLGFACLDSFYGWLALAQRAAQAGHVNWNLRDHERFCFRHWACSGRGTVPDPGLLYVEASWDDCDLHRLEPAFTRMHQRQHLAALSSIRR